MNKILSQTFCDRCGTPGAKGRNATLARTASAVYQNFERVRSQHGILSWYCPVGVGKHADLCKPCVRAAHNEWRGMAA